jgi:FkbM family methyltransferase
MKILIDVGCFNARTGSATYKLLRRKREKWFGYMIEPNPHMKEDIERNLSGLSFSYHNVAISDANGVAPFYFGKYGFTDRRSPRDKNKCMRSSLCNDKGFISTHLTEKSIQVTTQTLNSFIEDHRIQKIDLLKIDAEGKDYEILKEFFGNPLVYPEQIITEDYCKGAQESEQEVVALKKRQLIEGRGYSCIDQPDPINSHYLRRRVLA